MAKSKYTLKSGPFSFVFWPEISTSLRDPLGCSDLSQIFFGSSPIATEWDKIVAEIIHTTFVFLRHPKVCHIGAQHEYRLQDFPGFLLQAQRGEGRTQLFYGRTGEQGC